MTSSSPAKSKTAAIANDFGVPEALIGLAVGFVLSLIAVGIYAAVSHRTVHDNSLGGNLSSLCGLWIGLVGAGMLASRAHTHRRKIAPSFAQVAADFGVCIKPWPDLAVGVVVGIASQYLLVPIFELPLLPFVPHLFNRLGSPAQNLTSGVHGFGIVVLGLAICVGSPLVEEFFFRGLLLRGLLGQTLRLPRNIGPAVSLLVTGVVFGLVHFEALQLTGLIGFGIVLGVLAVRTGRLGPGMVAHAAFNATTFFTLVHHH